MSDYLTIVKFLAAVPKPSTFCQVEDFDHGGLTFDDIAQPPAFAERRSASRIVYPTHSGSKKMTTVP